MKKFSKFFVLSLCAVFAFNACQKENTPKTEQPTNSKKYITISCTIDSTPDSKVSLTKEGSVGKTEWEVGDKIFVHGKYAGTKDEKVYSCVATVKSLSADKKTASFDIPDIDDRYNNALFPGDRTNYAADLFVAYPADAVDAPASGYVKWYGYTPFKNTNTLLMAGCNDLEDATGGCKIKFYNLSGAISFKVSGDFDAYAFSGNNGETVGYSKYVARIDKYTLASSDKGAYRTVFDYTGSEGPGASSGAKTSITIESWTGADGTTNNFIYLPNGANFTTGFTFTFYKDGVAQKIAKVTNGANVARGKYLDLGDITSHLKNPPAAPVNHTDLSDGLVFGTATDLSSTASANCYIVGAAGQYKFKMVKGNSSISVGTVKGASIIWETYNNTDPVTAKSVIAAVDYYINDDDEYVVFKTPGTLKAGNALLAVKDAMDNILWSWHIWIPASTIIDITDATFSSTAIMDRNLGALEKATTTSAGLATHGFFYEWGRKDPFPGSATVNTAIAFETVDGPKSTLYSEQNPTKHIKVVENDTAGNWNTDDINTLWDNSGKTQYDPCPPGYRVPKFNESYKLWVKNGDNWTFDWTNVYFKYDSSDPIFPLPGYISGSTTPSYPGERALIWSASYHSAPRGYCKLIRKDKGGYYYHNYFKMEAGSVRCVVE